MQPGALPVVVAEPPSALFRVVPSVVDPSLDVRYQAHDINNKLGAILGFAELLQRPGIDSAKVSAFAASIHRAACSCADIARSMLAPAGAAAPERPAVDLHQVILDELALVAGALLQRGINLRVDRAAGHPRVRMDATELARIVANLTDNARDALLADSLIAAPRLPCIEVSTLLVERRVVVLSVADNGPGIPEDFHGRVWRDGYTTKAVSSETRRGFGLAVVRSIVEKAGGAVELRSAPGEGTAFRLHLPLA